MDRLLPPLSTLASQVARIVGGEVHVLQEGDYGAASIMIDGRHRVILRDHVRSFSVDVPSVKSWHLDADEQFVGAESRAHR